jgi:hypothetical protein
MFAAVYGTVLAVWRSGVRCTEIDRRCDEVAKVGTASSRGRLWCEAQPRHSWVASPPLLMLDREHSIVAFHLSVTSWVDAIFPSAEQ